MSKHIGRWLKTITLRSAIVLSVLAAGLGASAPAGAAPVGDGGGANHVVLAGTTVDGATVVHAGTQLAQSGGSTVESANIASATATSCTGCHATAVAVQVVLATGDVQYFAPSNAAVAVNADCTSCGTFAYAWQYVLHVDGPAHLSPEGRRQVVELEEEIRAAAASMTPVTLADDLTLSAKLDALTSQLRDVVDHEVQLGNITAVGARTVHGELSYRPS